MKLLAVVGANHFNEKIKDLFEAADITAYSQTNIRGHRETEENNLSDNWFASTKAFQNAILYFSFTNQKKAEQILTLVKKINETIDSESRIRAFIVPVENHI